jgi:hypothetical protein
MGGCMSASNNNFIIQSAPGSGKNKKLTPEQIAILKKVEEEKIEAEILRLVKLRQARLADQARPVLERRDSLTEISDYQTSDKNPADVVKSNVDRQVKITREAELENKWMVRFKIIIIVIY